MPDSKDDHMAEDLAHVANRLKYVEGVPESDIETVWRASAAFREKEKEE